MDKLTPGQLHYLANIFVRRGFGAYALRMEAEAEEAARRDAGAKVCQYGNACPDTGGPCPACQGAGSQDDGDPEIGQRLVDCNRCGGTGKAEAQAPQTDDLVQRCNEWLTRLTKDQRVIDANNLLTLCVERIEKQAGEIAGYCEEMSVIDDQLDDYKESHGNLTAERDALNARVARLEEALLIARQWVAKMGFADPSGATEILNKTAPALAGDKSNG